MCSAGEGDERVGTGKRWVGRRGPVRKRRIVETTMVGGASVARVAREHGMNANLVFGWPPLME